MIVEVALACTLLVGATLLTRSFVNVARHVATCHPELGA